MACTLLINTWQKKKNERALDNVLKFIFWLNYIYKKEISKITLKSEEIISFVKYALSRNESNLLSCCC